VPAKNAAEAAIRLLTISSACGLTISGNPLYTPTLCGVGHAAAFSCPAGDMPTPSHKNYMAPTRNRRLTEVNILQSLFQNSEATKNPPHVGEAFHLWTTFFTASESKAIVLILVNHTNDIELKESIEHFVADVLTPMIQRCQDVMKNEGIALPTVTPDAAKADERLIPGGAKITDDLLAQMVVIKLQGLMEYVYRGLSQSVREDIGSMFYSFLGHILAHGYSLRKLMEKRGWLRVPPFYYAGVSEN
jgi:hypothetical protein